MRANERTVERLAQYSRRRFHTILTHCGLVLQASLRIHDEATVKSTIPSVLFSFFPSRAVVSLLSECLPGVNFTSLSQLMYVLVLCFSFLIPLHYGVKLYEFDAINS